MSRDQSFKRHVHLILHNWVRSFIKVLIFCVEFQELSYSTRDLSQAGKKIIVVTSWATDKMTTIFTQNDNFDHFEWNRCHLCILSACNKVYFLSINWAYLGQPDNHIGWAKSIPFASIDPTYSRTNFWNFGKNCSAFGVFFESAILKFFCQIFFCFIPIIIVI